jgi:hypothetical protein
MAARADDTGGGQKSGGALRIVGVVVLALAAVGFGAVRMGFLHLPGSSSEDAVLSKVQDAPADAGSRASESSTSSASAKPGGSTAAGGVDLDAPAGPPEGSAPPAAPARRPGARTASSSGSGSALVSAVTSEPGNGGPSLGRVDEHVTYQYNALGRRDPFQSLLTGEYVPDHDTEGNVTPPDPGGMKIVGIVWGATDQFAMVEDARGNSYVLRKGDKVQNGFVEALRRDAVVVNITADGQSQTVVIPFVRKGDLNAH